MTLTASRFTFLNISFLNLIIIIIISGVIIFNNNNIHVLFLLPGEFPGSAANAESQNAKNLLRESKEKLRPAEKYSYHAVAAPDTNNNVPRQPNAPSKNAGDAPGSDAPTKQWGEPYKRKFPKEHVFEVTDDFRFVLILLPYFFCF